MSIAATGNRPPALRFGAAEATVSASVSTFTSDDYDITANGTDDAAFTITARNASGTALSGKASSITRETITVSAANSLILVSNANPDADESTDVTVFLRDASNRPVPDIAAADIVVSSTGTGNTIGSFTGRTSQAGSNTCTFESSVAQAKTLSFTVFGVAMTDTAAVTVGGTASLTPNLPSGLTLYSETTFGDVLNGQVFNAADYTVGGTQSGIADGDPRTDCNGTDATDPYGTDDDVYQYTYPGNNAGNGSGVPSDSGGEMSKLYSRSDVAAKRMYVAFYMWLSSDYVTHTNREKLFYPIGSGIATAIDIAIPSGGTAYGEIALNVQPQSGVGPQNTDQPSGPYIQKGVWNLIEIELTMNSGSNTTDGQMRYWLNGTLAWTLTGLNFGGSASNPTWDTFRIDGTRGGGASSVLTPPGGQTRKYAALASYYATSL